MYNPSKKRTAQLLLCSLLLESCYNPNLGISKKTHPAPAAPTYQQGQYEERAHDKPTSLTLTTADKHPIQFTYHPRQPQAAVRSQPPATSQPLPSPGREAPSTRPASLRKPHELLRSPSAAQAERLSLPPARPVQRPSHADQTSLGIANQALLAQGGQHVHFRRQAGQWQAQVTERIGAFSRTAVLPVVCQRHGDIAAALRALQAKPNRYSQRRLHVLPQKGPHPAMVFIGAQGLKGGMDRAGQPSGSGEPQPMGQGQELTALHPGSPPSAG